MKIACIGWGSLIWKRDGLKVQNHWFKDGPILPIEFTRISNNNRVTLIIDGKAKPIQTLWAFMTVDTLDDAKESLKLREGVLRINSIHSIGQEEEPKNFIEKIILDWIKEKKIDHAIWTGLSFSRKTENKRPSITEIIEHLKTIDSSERTTAEEYIRNAPKQIDTEYRREIELRFGWT